MTDHTPSQLVTITYAQALGLSASQLTAPEQAAWHLDQGRPLTALDWLQDAQAAVDALRAECVRQLRADGQTWAAIGAALGVSKQAAQQRYGR